MSFPGEIPSLRVEFEAPDLADISSLIDLRSSVRDSLKSARHSNGDILIAVRALQTYIECLENCKHYINADVKFLWRLPWASQPKSLSRGSNGSKLEIVGPNADESAALVAAIVLLIRSAETSSDPKQSLNYLKQAIGLAKFGAQLNMPHKAQKGVPADICKDTMTALAQIATGLLHLHFVDRILGLSEGSEVDAQHIMSTTSAAVAAVQSRSAAYAREQFGQAVQRTSPISPLVSWLRTRTSRTEALTRILQALEMGSKNHTGIAEGLCGLAEQDASDRQVKRLAADLKRLYQQENRLVSFEAVPHDTSSLPPLPSGRPVIDLPAWSPNTHNLHNANNTYY